MISEAYGLKIRKKTVNDHLEDLGKVVNHSKSSTPKEVSEVQLNRQFFP